MKKYINLRSNIAFGLTVAFLLNSLGPIPPSQAAVGGEFVLPKPGAMVSLSPHFNPPILKGIKVHPDNPFRFDFILDRGDSRNMLPPDASAGDLKKESTKLIKYFLASLTIPENDLWVNLSPYEKNRIIPQSFGLTEMGRDLLAEDYMLKQVTASLIYPEGEIGKKFWKKVYEEALKKYGTTNVAVNTFNKVWIVPQKAEVYENAKAGTAYVQEATLKVMLDQDYLALQKNESVHNGTSSLGANIIREIVIPELTQEVNTGRNFSQLRQVYNSLILANWYKRKIKDSVLGQVYENKNKIAGININDPQEKQKIYERYLQAFKKGAYNFIKEELDPVTQVRMPRKYFSGGIAWWGPNMQAAMIVRPLNPLMHFDGSNDEVLAVRLNQFNTFNAAMNVEQRPSKYIVTEPVHSFDINLGLPAVDRNAKLAKIMGEVFNSDYNPGKRNIKFEVTGEDEYDFTLEISENSKVLCILEVGFGNLGVGKIVFTHRLKDELDIESFDLVRFILLAISGVYGDFTQFRVGMGETGIEFFNSFFQSYGVASSKIGQIFFTNALDEAFWNNLRANVISRKNDPAMADNTTTVQFSVRTRNQRFKPRQWNISLNDFHQIIRTTLEEAGYEFSDEEVEEVEDKLFRVLNNGEFVSAGVMLNQIKRNIPFNIKVDLNALIAQFDNIASERRVVVVHPVVEPEPVAEPAVPEIVPLVENPPEEPVTIPQKGIQQFTLTGNGEYADLFKLDMVKRLFSSKSIPAPQRNKPRILLSGIDDQSIAQVVAAINGQDNIRGRDTVVLKDDEEIPSLTVLLNDEFAREALKGVRDIPLPVFIGEEKRLQELQPQEIADMKLVYSNTPKKRLMSASVGIYIDAKKRQKVYVVIAGDSNFMVHREGSPIEHQTMEDIHQNRDILQAGDFLPSEIKSIIDSPVDLLGQWKRDRQVSAGGAIYKDLMGINLRKGGTAAVPAEKIDGASLKLMIAYQDGGSSEEENEALRSMALAKLDNNGVLAVTRIYNSEETTVRLMDIYIKQEDHLDYEGTLVYPLGNKEVSLGIEHEPILNQARQIIYRQEESSRVMTRKYTYDHRNWGVINFVLSSWFRKRFRLDLMHGTHLVIPYGVSFWGFDAFYMRDVLSNPQAQMIATELQSETFDRVVVIKDQEVLRSLFESMKMIFTPNSELYLFIKNGRVVEVNVGIKQDGVMIYEWFAAPLGSKVYAWGKTGQSEQLTTVFERMLGILDENSLIRAVNQLDRSVDGSLGMSFSEGKWGFSQDAGSAEHKINVWPSLGDRLGKKGIGFQALDKGDDINVGDNSVSLLLASNVMMHLNEQEKDNFRKMLKVKLREGGVFISSYSDFTDDIGDEEICVYQKIKGEIVYQGTFALFKKRIDHGKLHVRQVNLSLDFSKEIHDHLFNRRDTIREYFVAEKNPGDILFEQELSQKLSMPNFVKSLLSHIGFDGAMTARADAAMNSFNETLQIESGRVHRTIRNDFFEPLWKTARMKGPGIVFGHVKHLAAVAVFWSLGPAIVLLDWFESAYYFQHQTDIGIISRIQMAYIVAHEIAHAKFEHSHSTSDYEMEATIEAIRILLHAGYSPKDIRKDVIPFIRNLRKLKDQAAREGAIVTSDETDQMHYESHAYDLLANAVGRVLDGFDGAQTVNANGGIDLTSDKAFRVNSDGQAIKFYIDPAMLEQLKNAPGFVPVIMSTQIGVDVKQFLGLTS